MRVYPSNLILNGDMSLASLTSNACDLNSMFGYAVQAIVSGSPVGILYIQASCDSASFSFNSEIVNWSIVSQVSISDNGKFMINCDAAFYRWVRVMYVKTSGTGSLTVNINTKGGN